ncbi:hypothetical protein B566_EDAN013148 [Ephemera danica]|nr:hypothetical protein B566_EDAN013148 [Ephemera danica]
MEDKKSTTMLWVQTSALAVQQMQQEPIEGQEWFYIPRPSLHAGAKRASSEGSRSSSSSARHAAQRTPIRTLSLLSEQPLQECQPAAVHNSTLTSSEASSASSQLSGSSGQLLVDRNKPSWLPAHPPPLLVKDEFTKKQDPELGRCDEDNVSLASSTHFTVVGAGRSARGGSGCCSHSHRLTALVLTMSLIFLAGITAACGSSTEDDPLPRDISIDTFGCVV